MLEEYLDLRSTDDIVKDIPKNLVVQYGEDILKQYLEDKNQLTEDIVNKIEQDMNNYKYDLEYRYFLNKYKNEEDEFGIVIDRDHFNHSQEMMNKVIKYCNQKKYNCFISNPCFEFWLLLHFSDVCEEYKDCLNEIKDNKKVSNKHTYVSKLLSEKVNHGKGNLNFEINYLNNVEKAIEHSEKFRKKPEELINDIGCNIGELINKMKKS